jgi:hypothetical protein
VAEHGSHTDTHERKAVLSHTFAFSFKYSINTLTENWDSNNPGSDTLQYGRLCSLVDNVVWYRMCRFTDHVVWQRLCSLVDNEVW